jgi:cell filamentation protein
VNPHVDAATGVVFNKLGITDREQLSAAEYKITHLRNAQLTLTPIPGAFDLDHLRHIHKHVFQDVYAWAGQERTLTFSKRDPQEPWWKGRFARHDQIPAIAKSIGEDLRAWNNLKGLAPKEFGIKFAAVYIKLNHMHPFPEGNGRAAQIFIAQLAKEAGYTIDSRKVDPKDWNQAAARSMPQINVREPAVTRKDDTTLIHAVFQRIAEPIRAKQVELMQPALKSSARDTPGPDR